MKLPLDQPRDNVTLNTSERDGEGRMKMQQRFALSKDMMIAKQCHAARSTCK